MESNLLSNIDTGGGLFGDSSDDEPKPKQNNKKKQSFDHNDNELYNSGDNDSDVDRPPLTEADHRRKANKARSKVKKKLTEEEIEQHRV